MFLVWAIVAQQKGEGEACQTKTHFENRAETKRGDSIQKLTVRLPGLTDFEYELVGFFLRVKDIHFELICISETCRLKASNAYQP